MELQSIEESLHRQAGLLLNLKQLSLRFLIAHPTTLRGYFPLQYLKSCDPKLVQILKR